MTGMAITSRTWSQIITGSLPAARPGGRTPPGNPGPRKNTTPESVGAPNSGRSPNPARRGRNGGFGRGRQGATQSGCSIPPRNHPGSPPCPGLWGSAAAQARGDVAPFCHGRCFRQRLAPRSAALVSAPTGTADDCRRRCYRGGGTLACTAQAAHRNHGGPGWQQG